MIKKIAKWFGCSLSREDRMTKFMNEVNKMDVDPLVLDRFLHEGFDTDIDTFKMYLKFYYEKKA